jgi:DNA polymerase III epsilon subunit-like protein
MVKILVFDTETTGLDPVSLDLKERRISYATKENFNKGLVTGPVENAYNSFWEQIIPEWPYITQLSYILYNTDDPNGAKIFDKYIQLPTHVIISAESSAITHIYRSHTDALNKGVNPNTPGLIFLDQTPVTNIVSAIEEFMHDFSTADVVVGHNVEFDKKMILAELKRLNKVAEFGAILLSEDFVCTMMKTINVCKKKVPGKEYFKFPRLSEAYETLFGYAPTGDALHNAIIDVVVCLRVFCKLGSQVGDQIIDFDVCGGENREITELINSVSPPEFKCVEKEKEKEGMTTRSMKKGGINSRTKEKKNEKKRRKRKTNKKKSTSTSTNTNKRQSKKKKNKK